MWEWWFDLLILVLSSNILDESPIINQTSLGPFAPDWHSSDSWHMADPYAKCILQGTAYTRICSDLFKSPNLILFPQLLGVYIPESNRLTGSASYWPWRKSISNTLCYFVALVNICKKWEQGKHITRWVDGYLPVVDSNFAASFCCGSSPPLNLDNFITI